MTSEPLPERATVHGNAELILSLQISHVPATNSTKSNLFFRHQRSCQFYPFEHFSFVPACYVSKYQVTRHTCCDGLRFMTDINTYDKCRIIFGELQRYALHMAAGSSSSISPVMRRCVDSDRSGRRLTPGVATNEPCPAPQKNNSVLFKIFVEARSVFVPINVSRAHEPSVIDFESVTNSATRLLRQEIDYRLTESTGLGAQLFTFSHISLLSFV